MKSASPSNAVVYVENNGATNLPPAVGIIEPGMAPCFTRRPTFSLWRRRATRTVPSPTSNFLPARPTSAPALRSCSIRLVSVACRLRLFFQLAKRAAGQLFADRRGHRQRRRVRHFRRGQHHRAARSAAKSAARRQNYQPAQRRNVLVRRSISRFTPTQTIPTVRWLPLNFSPAPTAWASAIQ